MRDIRKQYPLAMSIKGAPSVNGFSYPLQRLLVDRLEDLLTENKLFEHGNTKAHEESDNGYGSVLTGVGLMVVLTLGESTGIQITRSYSGIEKFLEDANNFLSTFEV